MCRAAAALLVLLLAGCEATALRIENQRLRDALEQQQGAAAAEIARRDRAAAIAQACDWLVPICPAGLVGPGRAALAEGYGPSRLGLGLLGIKLLVLIVPLAGAIGAGAGAAGWVWARVSGPALQRADEARRLLAAADARQARAQAEIDRLSTELRERRAQVEDAEDELDRLAAEVSRLRQTVQRLQKIRGGLSGL